MYTTQNKDQRQTSMSSMRIEPVTPAIMRAQTYDLDGTATGIDLPGSYASCI
jgi:hypothetical protein